METPGKDLRYSNMPSSQWSAGIWNLLADTHTVRFSAMHSATTRVLQLYPAVLTALKDVCKRPEDFDAAVRAKSEGLLTRFSDFETLITLMVFKKIFDIVGPHNTFLQTLGLDLALQYV